MNAFCKVPTLLFAIALAAFALPSVAKPGPTKTYSLKADASHVSYTMDANSQRVLDVSNGGAPISVTIKNESPPPNTANSNISSFSFTVTGMVISSLDIATCESLGGICALNGNTVTVTNISPPIQQQGTYTVPIRVNSCGDGAWSAQVYSGSQLNGGLFGFTKETGFTNTATNVSCGDAGCGLRFSVPNNLLVLGSPTDVSGVRGTFNKDGGTCSTVDYFATNTIPDNETLHFEWTTSEVGATFRYTATFKNPGAPQLAWFTDSLGPVGVDAQACLQTQFANNLPAPYGTLAQDVNSTKTKIQVNVLNAPAISLSFPIIVEGERMQVTAINNNQWTVSRGQGGTRAASHSATPTVFIMSTPRPLLTGPFDQRQSNAGYKVNDQAHGCIDAPLDPTTWPSTSTFSIIDIDDIWTIGR
ncbi:MAG TPA: hypothetical protein VN858_06975 [Casimicrobiaceae bacterium]|nr:hypothetical protein [Casimicrobiaceae bacterium]